MIENRVEIRLSDGTIGATAGNLWFSLAGITVRPQGCSVLLFNSDFSAFSFVGSLDGLGIPYRQSSNSPRKVFVHARYLVA